ncbi:ATP-binding protein, partial [Synechococcus sp. F70.1]|uniref:ATP-binding protein n=1 Tax=Synechococcus sp. F70.1 TaxID=2964532 RepID=UPI0039C5E648
MRSTEPVISLPEQQKDLEALKEVDFDWTVHLKKIWQVPEFDVPDLNREAREQLFERLEKLIQSPKNGSPLGIPVLGSGGTGKTHLLRVLRQRCFEKGVGFVLVDMTDVKDFWKTLVQGYLTSLMQEEPDGRSQLEKVLDQIFLKALASPRRAEEIGRLPPNLLFRVVNRVLQWLSTQDKSNTLKYRDCVRAMILANSANFAIAAAGISWIEGLGVDPEMKEQLGFDSPGLAPSETVAGLSWLMSLRGPTVVALDQLDPIIVQFHIASEESGAEAKATENIIHSIGGGLIAIRDYLSRSLVVVSCLEESWEILTKTAVSTFSGRFESPLLLALLPSAATAEAVVVSRLEKAYRKVGFTPPYSSYPFKPEFFESNQFLSPRELLRKCHEHRESCLKAGKVIELGSSGSPLTTSSAPLQELDREFEKFRKDGDISPYFQENENELWKELLTSICHFLIWQEKLPPSIGSQVETDFPGSKSFSQLHSRLRLIFHEANEQEKHLCLIAIQSGNPKAFQARLGAAKTAAGIDPALRSRKLVVVRTIPVPRGPVSQKLWQSFLAEGGIHWRPSEEEIRVLLALEQLQSRPGFRDWLAERQPLTHLANAELDSGLAKIL